MKPHVVTIEIDQLGQGKVSLDGLELTTSRVEFVSDAHRPTEVRLAVYATVQARLELTPEQLAGEAETGNVKWDVRPGLS